jgi:hypothetical protein
MQKKKTTKKDETKEFFCCLLILSNFTFIVSERHIATAGWSSGLSYLR